LKLWKINHGLLIISTKKEDDQCVIEIKDNGKGMDEEMVTENIRTLFYRKHDGNGLGLTNTQNIILNHNGKIKVTSKPGQGSSFFVTPCYLLKV
jgi:signal transduction histidine kinase